jgi:hypothetical protein
VLGIDHHHLKLAHQPIIDRTPIHASPNVAKKVLDWEYTIEILRVHLRTRTGDRLQALPHSTALSHEGSIPQGPGASHVQVVASEQQASGGEHHV